MTLMYGGTYIYYFYTCILTTFARGVITHIVTCITSEIDTTCFIHYWVMILHVFGYFLLYYICLVNFSCFYLMFPYVILRNYFLIHICSCIDLAFSLFLQFCKPLWISIQFKTYISSIAICIIMITMSIFFLSELPSLRP